MTTNNWQLPTANLLPAPVFQQAPWQAARKELAILARNSLLRCRLCSKENPGLVVVFGIRRKGSEI